MKTPRLSIFAAVKISSWLTKSRARSAADGGATAPSAAAAAPADLASMLGATAAAADAGAKDANTDRPPLSADEIRRLGRAHRQDQRFIGVVGKYWAAMTDNGNLNGGYGVNFSLYQKVHMRIAKTLTKEGEELTEEDAMQVAREDYERLADAVLQQSAH